MNDVNGGNLLIIYQIRGVIMTYEQEVKKALMSYCLPHRLIPMKTIHEKRLESFFDNGYGGMILQDYTSSATAFSEYMVVGRYFLILMKHGVIMYPEITSMVFDIGSPSVSSDNGGGVPASWGIKFRDSTNNNTEEKTTVYLDVTVSDIFNSKKDVELQEILKNYHGFFNRASVKQSVLMEKDRREHLEFGKFIKSKGIELDDYLVRDLEEKRWTPTYINYRPYYIE